MKTMGFQYFINRDPVNACRFHRDRRYSEGCQPGCHALKVGGESFEGLNGLFGEVCGNGNNMKARAKIYQGGAALTNL
uniref:hypothetical protein n=1 Tax=Pseudomonas mucidolens TaxID=46679 RepID=UPI0018D509BA